MLIARLSSCKDPNENECVTFAPDSPCKDPNENECVTIAPDSS